MARRGRGRGGAGPGPLRPRAPRCRATGRRRLALAVAVLSMAVPACVPLPPADVYELWVGAQNRGDVATQVSLLREDARLVAWSFCLTTCTGRAAIRRELENQALLGGESPPPTPTIAGTTITARRELRSEATRRAGVERIILLDRFETRDGKIATASMRLDLEDALTATFYEFLRAQSGWRHPLE